METELLALGNQVHTWYTACKIVASVNQYNKQEFSMDSY